MDPRAWVFGTCSGDVLISLGRDGNPAVWVTSRRDAVRLGQGGFPGPVFFVERGFVRESSAEESGSTALVRRT